MVFIEGALSSYLFDAEIYLDGIIKRQTVVSETFLNGPIPASFSFLSFQKLTMDMLIKKVCRWLDLSNGPLVLEASTLPTEPQPIFQKLCTVSVKSNPVANL